MEKFAPRIVVRDDYYGDHDYTPAGWEWVLGFALAGCEWAIEEASKADFKNLILESLRERKRLNLRSVIEDKLREVDRLREELESLEGSL